LKADWGCNLPDTVGKCLGILEGSSFSPIRLIDTDAVQDGGELVPVLGVIDLLGIRTKYVDTAVLEPQGDVLGELTWKLRP